MEAQPLKILIKQINESHSFLFVPTMSETPLDRINTPKLLGASWSISRKVRLSNRQLSIERIYRLPWFYFGSRQVIHVVHLSLSNEVQTTSPTGYLTCCKPFWFIVIDARRSNFTENLLALSQQQWHRLVTLRKVPANLWLCWLYVSRFWCWPKPTSQETYWKPGSRRNLDLKLK